MRGLRPRLCQFTLVQGPLFWQSSLLLSANVDERFEKRAIHRALIFPPNGGLLTSRQDLAGFWVVSVVSGTPATRIGAARPFTPFTRSNA